MPTGLGGEQLWVSATNDNTGTSSAYYDQSGQGNNGTNNGSTVVSETSKGGSYAFYFDGVNDFIRIYDVFNGSGGFADFLNSSDNWTFSVYAQTDGYLAGGGVRQTLAGVRLRGKTAGVIFGINLNYSTDYSLSSKLFKAGYSVSSVNWNNDPSVDSDWHHVCFVNDGGTVSLYIDGVASSGTRTKSSDTSGIVTGFTIGQSGGNSVGYYFKGKMDDIRVYARTITQAEITHLATSRGIEGPPSSGVYDPFTNKRFNAGNAKVR